MQTEHWRRVFEVAEAALEPSGGNPEDDVSKACGDDPNVHADVLRLLGDSSRDEGFLDTPVCRLEDDRLPDAAASDVVAGRVIGPYRISRELGHGGMGTVYLAERVDGEYRRRVALKLLHLGTESEEIVRRFRNERQILANLAHPNIAEMYDGGTTDDGQPYLVMEHVDGIALDEYCDAAQLDTRQRLELFLKVCSAVEHAHQSFVVHRDLKPSNVLVTRRGEPKLLDFGIAKWLPPEPSLATVDTIGAGGPMTPDYASPEHVLGEPVSAASDVYSLGVLLYELLAGRRPYSLTELSRAEVRRVICEEEPVPPSERVTGEARKIRRREVRGDLDHITLKALRKSRPARYPSVEELRQDIERHLHGVPIQARPQTIAYRLAKLVRRRARETAAAALLAAALIGVAVREHHLRRQVADERDKAQEISLFLKGLFEQSDPNHSPERLTLREVLDRGTKKIDSFSDRPLLQAMYLETTGDAYRSLGLFDSSLPLLERALAIRQKIHGEEHVEVAESLDDMAELFYYKGDLKRAELYYRQALEMRERLLGDRHPDIAETSSNLGVLLEDQGRYDSAEPLLRRAVSIYRATHGPNHSFTASALNNLAILLHDKGNLDQAEETYRSTLDAQRKALGSEHPLVATAMNNLAVVLADKNDYEAAETSYRDALSLRRKVLGDDHPDTLQSVSAMGSILFLLGRYDASEPFFRDALDGRRRILGKRHSSTAMTMVRFAWMLLARKDHARAELLAREGLDVLERELPNDWHTPLAEGIVGACSSARGRLDEAEPLLLRSHAALQAKRGPNAKVTRDVCAWIGAHYRVRGQRAPACETALKEADPRADSPS